MTSLTSMMPANATELVLMVMAFVVGAVGMNCLFKIAKNTEKTDPNAEKNPEKNYNPDVGDLARSIKAKMRGSGK